MVNSKVQQDYFTLQIAQLMGIPLHITKADIDDTGFGNNFFRQLQNFLLRCTGILHSLNHNIIEILGAIRMRIIIIQTGGNGCKALNIILAIQRIEDKVIIQFLEQSKISGSRIGSCKNIFSFHLILIIFHQGSQFFFKNIGTYLMSLHLLHQLIHLILQLHLLQRQFLYLSAVCRTFYRISRSKISIRRFQSDSFRRIHREIDNLVVHTKAVELRRYRTCLFETERTVTLQLYRIQGHDALQSSRFQVQHFAVGT